MAVCEEDGEWQATRFPLAAYLPCPAGLSGRASRPCLLGGWGRKNYEQCTSEGENEWLVGKEKEFLTGNADPTQCVCEQYTFTAGCGAIDGPEVQRSSTVSFSSLSVNFG